MSDSNLDTLFNKALTAINKCTTSWASESDPTGELNYRNEIGELCCNEEQEHLLKEAIQIVRNATLNDTANLRNKDLHTVADYVITLAVISYFYNLLQLETYVGPEYEYQCFTLDAISTYFDRSVWKDVAPHYKNIRSKLTYGDEPWAKQVRRMFIKMASEETFNPTIGGRRRKPYRRTQKGIKRSRSSKRRNHRKTKRSKQ